MVYEDKYYNIYDRINGTHKLMTWEEAKDHAYKLTGEGFNIENELKILTGDAEVVITKID